jgi:threonine dehydratase/serine racemase
MDSGSLVESAAASLSVRAPTAADVAAAAGRLKGIVHRTSILRCSTLDRLSGFELFFKCENFQRVGAFKFRGATNAIRQLSPAELARGVVTHSSGNHAQAVALAARMHSVPAYIVMPTSSSAIKRAAVVDYGATVIDCEPRVTARQEMAARVQTQTGAALVHPFDDARVIAGQGTAALELLEDVDNLDAIITPVGGGGLVSGTCLAVELVGGATRVYAAEPSGADDAARSKAAGRRMDQTDPQTIADGLLTSLGQLTWPLVRDRVAAVITVSDSEIIAAMRLVWQRMKLVIEPSSATVVAALLKGTMAGQGLRRVGAIFSGGNVDLDHLPW